jgi:tetratricopeptide (TPR) repeat protein
MLFGADKRFVTLFAAALLTWFSSACGQTREAKMNLARQHADKAMELRQKGDIAGAIKAQLEAVELDSKNVEYQRNLIGFYLDANDLKKAKETAEKTLVFAPQDAWVHYLYGEALSGLGDKNGALMQYQKAVNLNPNYPVFMVNLAVIYGELGETGKAREYYEQAIKADPNYATASYNLAILEEAAGNREKAMALYRNVIALEREDEEMVSRAREKLQNLENLKKTP